MAVSAPNTDNLLNCSICLDEFKVPVSLPCGHTFCKECIENHWSKALQGKAAPPFMCPQCRKAYTVVPPLHKNVVIDDVVRDRRERRERRERRQSGDRRWSVELLSAFKQTLTDRERVTTALSSSLLDKLGAAEEAAECFKRRLSASYDDLLRLVAEDHELALRAVDAERDAKLSAIRHKLGRCTEVLGGLRETLSRIGELEATRDDAEFLQVHEFAERAPGTTSERVGGVRDRVPTAAADRRAPEPLHSFQASRAFPARDAPGCRSGGGDARRGGSSVPSIPSHAPSSVACSDPSSTPNSIPSSTPISVLSSAPSSNPFSVLSSTPISVLSSTPIFVPSSDHSSLSSHALGNAGARTSATSTHYCGAWTLRMERRLAGSPQQGRIDTEM
ncbi:unnamed protein product [Lampetra fluviatilis]